MRDKIIYILKWEDILNVAENEELIVTDKDFNRIKEYLETNIKWYDTIIDAINHKY